MNHRINSFANSEFETYNKYKIAQTLVLILKQGLLIDNFIHGDLHNKNWKIRPYKDFYQLIIYDFGFCIYNDVLETYKKLHYGCDVDNYSLIGEVIYENLITEIDEKQFLNDFTNYLINNNKHACYHIDSMKNVIKFLILNKLILIGGHPY